jgi:hypothetical protein
MKFIKRYLAKYISHLVNYLHSKFIHHNLEVIIQPNLLNLTLNYSLIECKNKVHLMEA